MPSGRKRLNPVTTAIQSGVQQVLAETRSNVEEISGQKFLDHITSGTIRGKQMRNMYRDLVKDLGGASFISFAQSEVARRCATMAVIAQEMEARLATYDESFDTEGYVLLSRTQAALLKMLGMKRVTVEVNPKGKTGTLTEYLSDRSQE